MCDFIALQRNGEGQDRDDNKDQTDKRALSSVKAVHNLRTAGRTESAGPNGSGWERIAVVSRLGDFRAGLRPLFAN